MKASLKRDLLFSTISLIVVAATLGSLLFYQFSMARYTSSIDGTIEYDPALFNTVLLGNLSFTHEVETPNGGTVEVTEANGKLGTGIVVDSSMDFGAVEGDMTSDERRLRPGSVVAIPFTVTNGTTLPSELTGEEGNLAETDILYSISLITTVNLPLVYDVYVYTTETQLSNFTEKSKNDNYNYTDYISETQRITANDANWGTKLVSHKGDITESPLIGHSCTYEVRPTTYDANSDDEEKNFFSLERDESNSNISVDRYMLVISWPTGTGAEYSDNRDTKYMKEIDILEIRLEVLSWVKNTTVQTPSYTDGTKSVLAIAAVSLGNEAYYFLPAAADNPIGINESNVFARSTVPFYATRSSTGVNGTREDYLDFIVTNNTGQIEYKWNAELGSYETVTSQNALSNGHVAIAVPVQEVMGTKNNYTEIDEETGEAYFKYFIEYNGKSYFGVLTDKYITTDVWGKEEETLPYGYQRKNAYQIIEFYETLEGGEQKLMELEDFGTANITEQELRLVIQNNKDSDYDNTDNFKILVYSGTEG